MTVTDTTVSNLIINTMTAAQYATITPSDTELYFVTDEAISSSDVITALGYTPYNSSNPNGYQANVLETVKVNGTALTPTTKTVNITVPAAVTETTVSGWGFTKNVGTVTKVNNTSPDSNGNVTIAIPTSTTDLTNDSGFITGITSGMVTTALGFTPYSNANPNGYQANVIETVKVNGTALTPSTKTVSLTVPTSTTQLTNDSGFITGITSSDVTTALGYTPYNSNNPSGYQANVIETVKVNGTALTPSTKTVSLTVPTDTGDLTNGAGFITSADLSGYQTTSNLVTSVTSAGTDAQYPSAKAVYTATNANATAISTIEGKIPSAATSSNQLADKAFVNSSIATNTAYFIGTFNSVAELEAYSGTLTNNDYAFVATTDTAGNTLYDRYKYNSSTQEWAFEYELNNSSFTSGQWAAINSGITSDSKVTRSSTAAVGNTTTPVYVNTSGVVTTCAALNTAAYVADNTLVHLAGAETITGNKTFSGTVSLGSSATATTPTVTSNDTTVATTKFVKDQGYKTTVTSTDVTNALGYTPVKTYSATNPQLTPTSNICTWTLSHNLGDNVHINVFNAMTKEEVIADVTYTSSTTATIKLLSSSVLASGAFKAVAMGN